MSSLKNKLFYTFFFLITLTYGQNNSKKVVIKSGKTSDVLKQVELVFEVYYSYADSLLINKNLILEKKRYTLYELHEKLLVQNNIKAIIVNNQLYSLVSTINSQKIVVLNEIVLKGYFINTLVKDTKKTTLKSFNSEVLPGISDFDVLKAVQQLPGVKSPNQTATGLYVKGGVPDQNSILWNDIRLYHTGHLFGMISPVNPEMVDVASFYSSNIPTSYGGRVSSIIDMRTSEETTSNKKIKVGINMLYADYYQKILSPNKKVSLKYSIRKSISPLFNTPTYRSYAEKVFQNTTFNQYNDKNKFDFWDGSLALNWQIDQKNSIKFSSVLVKNNLDYSNNLKDTIIQNQKMTSENSGISIQYNASISDKTNLKSTVHFSDFNFKYDRQIKESDKVDLFLKKNNILESGVDLQLNYLKSKEVNYSIGYQISNNHVSHLINSNNENFGFNISEKDNLLQQNSLHFNAEIIKSKYEINVGSRITSTEFAPILFEPRMSISRQFNEVIKAKISYEKRSQIVQQINENAAGDISLENFIWVTSDFNTIPIVISNQVNASILYKKKDFFIDFEFYVKKNKGITSFSNGVVFSSSEIFSAIPTLTSGNNFSTGIDIAIQKKVSNWNFWTSYSFLNSENKISGINDGNYFKSNGNIKNAINLSTSFKTNNFYITMGWFWHSGRPFSEINQNNEIASLNSKDLKNFHSLDLSTRYNIMLKSNYKLTTGIAINNIYNHKVIINKEISRSYNSITDVAIPKYKVTDFYSLGFTTNIFLKFSF